MTAVEGAPTDNRTCIDETRTLIGIVEGVTPPQPGEISDVAVALHVGYALAILPFSAMRTNPPVQDYFQRALDLLVDQEHPDLDKAIEANYRMGWYLGSTGHPEEALRYAEECQRLQPDRYEGTRLAARTYYTLGQRGKAVKLYVRSLLQEVSQKGLSDTYVDNLLYFYHRIFSHGLSRSASWNKV
ncbi:hypothetical protein HYW21_01795 [Candidatus Woesearchaeota archaeon]|nr:hypothetical protein [Candidatus Woesearchaeota archaeon]